MKNQIRAATQQISSSFSSWKSQIDSLEHALHTQLQAISSIKLKSKNTLTTSLQDLKSEFQSFANEWKTQLPMVLCQFMDIVQKIVEAYQQRIDKLNQENRKWEFSYHQLTQSIELKSKTDSFLEKEERISDIVKKEGNILSQKITELFENDSELWEWRKGEDKVLRERDSNEGHSRGETKDFWKGLNSQISLDLHKKCRSISNQNKKASDDRNGSRMTYLRKNLYGKHRNSFDRRV